MSSEAENEVSQDLPAAWLKELTYLSKGRSSSKLGSQLECARSRGIPHCAGDVSQGVLLGWDCS